MVFNKMITNNHMHIRFVTISQNLKSWAKKKHRREIMTLFSSRKEPKHEVNQIACITEVFI